MSLCSEAEFRSTLTDVEFWERVFHGDDGPDDYDPDEAPKAQPLAVPCEVCGARDEACAYDDLGRPMIHATEVAE